MQVHYLVSIGFNCSPHPLAGDLVRTDIQQDSCGIPHQRYGPVGDDDGTNDAGQGVHPEPPIQLGQDQAGDGQDGYEGIREDVDVSGADAVVAEGSLGGGARVLAAMGRVGGQALAVGAMRAGSTAVRMVGIAVRMVVVTVNGGAAVVCVIAMAMRVVAMVVGMAPAVVRAMGAIMATVGMRVGMVAVNGGIAVMCVVAMVMRVAVAALSKGRAGREDFCVCVGWCHGVLRLAVPRSTVARSTVVNSAMVGSAGAVPIRATAGAVTMTAMAVSMVVAAEQPRADNVDQQPHYRNGNGFVERDRHRRNEAFNRLIADKQRNHSQHDRTGKSRQVAEFSGPKHKPMIRGMSPRIRVCQRGDQHRPSVRGHVQAIGYQRQRVE